MNPSDKKAAVEEKPSQKPPKKLSKAKNPNESSHEIIFDTYHPLVALIRMLNIMFVANVPLAFRVRAFAHRCYSKHNTVPAQWTETL